MLRASTGTVQGLWWPS